MQYLYIKCIPLTGTMKNEIKFGIMFAAIAAVAAGTFAIVLDDAFAEPPKKNPGQFPPGQTQGGGQSPGNSPPGNSGGGPPPGQKEN